MTVLEIVEAYVRENGYDGLCNPEGECGCGLDDFTVCGEICIDCEPAHKKMCESCENKSDDPDEGCTIISDNGFGYCFWAGKRPESADKG